MGKHSNPKFYRTNFMDTVTLDDGEQQLNLFDPKLIKLLRNIREYLEVQYVPGTPLTTLAYRYYRTTSLAWLILTYNGYLTELEIPPGTNLKIPSLRNIQDIQSTQQQSSRVGQIVRI